MQPISWFARNHSAPKILAGMHYPSLHSKVSAEIRSQVACKATLQPAIMQYSQVEHAPQIVRAGYNKLIVREALKLFGCLNNKFKQVQLVLAYMHYS